MIVMQTMKKTLFTSAIFVLVFLAGCIKDDAPDPVNGTWKLVEVYDKTNTSTFYPPIGATSDIIITFAAGHKFYGHTINNSFGDGSYVISGGDRIMFGSYITTEVAEDYWGEMFYASLECVPAGTGNCSTSQFTVQGTTLKFVTPTRYDLILQKL